MVIGFELLLIWAQHRYTKCLFVFSLNSTNSNGVTGHKKCAFTLQYCARLAGPVAV